jgi:hypothetical protein
MYVRSAAKWRTRHLSSNAGQPDKAGSPPDVHGHFFGTRLPLVTASLSLGLIQSRGHSTRRSHSAMPLVVRGACTIKRQGQRR